MVREFTVVKRVSEGQIVDLLANGLAEMCGFDNIDFDNQDYQAAKESLLSEGKQKNDLCRKDVWARMLFLGKVIKLHANEEDEDEGWYELTLDNILKQDIDWDKLADDGDFFDNDAILQKACYGEVIYG